MYYVMSAEDVDTHNEPFLQAICESEDEAREVVGKFVKQFGLVDYDGKLLKPGVGDGDKWADARYDEDGLTAWNTDMVGGRCMSVFAKYVDTTRLEMCL